MVLTGTVISPLPGLAARAVCSLTLLTPLPVGLRPFLATQAIRLRSLFSPLPFGTLTGFTLLVGVGRPVRQALFLMAGVLAGSLRLMPGAFGQALLLMALMVCHTLLAGALRIRTFHRYTVFVADPRTVPPSQLPTGRKRGNVRPPQKREE